MQFDLLSLHVHFTETHQIKTLFPPISGGVGRGAVMSQDTTPLGLILTQELQAVAN
jgi:hypothetical protein